MKRKNLFYLLSGAFGVLALVLTVLVAVADVKPVGVNNTDIGLSTLNKAVFDSIGVNDTWYKITKIFGYFAVVIAFCFAVLFGIQFLKRKNPFKADKEVLFLIGLYVATAVVFCVFELFVINYRPVLSDGELEGSFPSTHALLVCVATVSAIGPVNKYIKNKPLKVAVASVLILIATLTAVGRLISGVHWLTDVIGGILYALALCFSYFGLIAENKPQPSV